MGVSERVRQAIAEDTSVDHLCWAVGDDGDVREVICQQSTPTRFEIRMGSIGNAIDCTTGHRFARSWGYHDSRQAARDYLSDICGFVLFARRDDADQFAIGIIAGRMIAGELR